MKFSEVFSRGRAFLPVVHVNDPESAVRNARIARDDGADGVFLVNHRISADELLRAYAHVRARHPGWWIGLNFLGEGPASAFQRLPVTASGIWIDAGGPDPDAEEPTKEVEQISLFRRQCLDRGWRGLYFGSVAFKYQPPVRDAAAAARLAAPFMDVVMTSGEATGSPAPLQKIRSMRAALGDHSFGIASGVTAENIDAHLSFIDVFLVSTGISIPKTEDFDPRLVRLLADRIRAF